MSRESQPQSDPFDLDIKTSAWFWGYFSKRVPKISGQKVRLWFRPICLRRKNRKLSLGTLEILKFAAV